MNKIIPNFIARKCTCAGKSNNYGEGAECKEYSGYTNDWRNGRWCYADVEACPDAKDHPSNSNPGYGASRAACLIGISLSVSQPFGILKCNL